MIISDRTTSLTFTNSFCNPDQTLSVSTSMTAGGRMKMQTGGERFEGEETLRCTGSELRALYTLLQSGATEYYYTPTETPPEYTSVSFPITVAITDIKKNVKATSDGIVYHVSMRVTGTEYI